MRGLLGGGGEATSNSTEGCQSLGEGIETWNLLDSGMNPNSAIYLLYNLGQDTSSLWTSVLLLKNGTSPMPQKAIRKIKSKVYEKPSIEKELAIPLLSSPLDLCPSEGTRQR